MSKDAVVNAGHVTVTGNVSGPAYNNAQSQGLPGASAMVNTIMSMVMPMVFREVRDARSWSAYGGGGSFRPSETWARAQDQNARASAMGIASPDRVAAEVSRRTQQYAQDMMRSGVGISPTQQREYANSIEPQARAAVRTQLAESKKHDIDNLTRAYQNIALSRYSKEELTDKKREDIAIEAREQATKLRESLANPMTAAIAMAGVRALEERGGAGISNLAPELFLGGGVFDALRTRTGLGSVAPGVASDITKTMSDMMFNEDGTVNYGFTHGRSALQMGDLMVSGAARGMIDTSVATGRAGTIGTDQYETKKQALIRDMHQMAEIGESLQDLFGSGGSVDDMLTRFDQMTGGAMRTMSKDRVKRLIADTAFVASSTGQSTDQIEAMLSAEVQYAARAGLPGEIGTKIGLNALLQAGTVNRLRDGNTYMGMQDMGDLAGTIMQETVAGVMSDDAIAMGAATSTARMIAQESNIAGADTMSGPAVFEAVAKQAEARGDLATAARMRGLGNRIYSGDFGDLDSTEAIGILSQAAGRDVSIEFSGKRLTQDNNVKAEQADQIVAIRRRQLKDKDELIADSVGGMLSARSGRNGAADVAKNKDMVKRGLRAIRKYAPGSSSEMLDVLSRELGISREDASSMKSLIDSTLSENGFLIGETGGAIGYGKNNADAVFAEQASQLRRHEVNMAMDSALREQGIGSGSIFQKLIGDITADPGRHIKTSLGKLLTGEVSLEDYKHVAPIVDEYLAATQDIGTKVASGELTEAEGDAAYRVANEKMIKAVADSPEARKEIAEWEARAATGDAGLDTQKAIEKNTAETARNTDPDRKAKEREAKEREARNAAAEKAELEQRKALEADGGKVVTLADPDRPKSSKTVVAPGTAEGHSYFKKTVTGSKGEIVYEEDGTTGATSEGYFNSGGW